MTSIRMANTVESATRRWTSRGCTAATQKDLHMEEFEHATKVFSVMTTAEQQKVLQHFAHTITDARAWPSLDDVFIESVLQVIRTWVKP